MVLVEGSISVLPNQGDEHKIHPGELAVLNGVTQEVQISKVDIEPYIAWNSGRFVFDNCSLEDILKDLGKWYDFDVRYAWEDARLIPFSLNIKKHDAFAEVLQLLEDTGCVKFDIRDNVVVVK